MDNTDFESTTAILSSSELRISLLMFFSPRKFRIDFDIKDIRYISGLKILIRRSRSQEAGKAIFSGFFAANVFGVFSAKIKITNVKAKEAIITDPLAPNLQSKKGCYTCSKYINKVVS